MSWFSKWFQSNTVQLILKLGAQILKQIVGKVAEDIQRIAYAEVSAAEATGKTGAEKYEIVFKAMKKRFPEIRESIINHSIESAVLAIQSISK